MLTVGHSTLPIETFIGALQENAVRLLVDVRTIPRSRHNPQFGIDVLPGSLAKAGIEYKWMRELGGLRHSKKDSINRGWRNASFRGYADYMQTADFARALEALIALDKQTTAAIMCSEAVPWRCHRSLLGDALLAHQREVEDIYIAPTGQTHRKPHVLTVFAKVDGDRLWYPSGDIDARLPIDARSDGAKQVGKRSRKKDPID